jgi:hypothetical protein
MSILFRTDGVCKFLVFLVFIYVIHNLSKLFDLGYFLELHAYLLSALHKRVEKAKGN